MKCPDNILDSYNRPFKNVIRREFCTYLLLCTVGWVISCANATSQTRPASSGSEFVLNLPHLYLDLDANLLVSVTAVTSGWVSIIENERGDSTTRFLSADSAWHFRIPRSVIGFPLQQEGRSRRSVRVRATGLVTVQGAYDGDYVTDSWLVPPVRDLGRSHRIISIWSPSVSGGVAAVTATEDSTTVRVTPSVPTSRGSPGFSYGVTLNAGDVWHIVPSVPEFTDISGTRIVADKPVYVLAGHSGAQLFGRGANNPMIEWMPPLSHWGEEFVAEPFPRRPEGLYKILADQNGTALNVNNVTIDTLDAGESRWWIDPFPVHFSSSKPILVAQFVDHRDTSITTQDGDPSMTILQPVRAWSRSYLWQTLDLPTRFVLSQGSDAKLPFDDFLVVAADFSAGLFPIMLDGRDISDFLARSIGGTGYSIGWIPMTSETHRLESRKPVSAQVLGFNVFDAYAHPPGYPVPPLVDIPDLYDTLCQDRYTGEIRIANRTDEIVVIDSISVRNGTSLGLTPGTKISGGGSILATLNRSIPTIGPHNDTVILNVRGERTGRTAIVIATIEIMRLPLSLGVTQESLDFSTATPAEPEISRSIVFRNDGILPYSIDQIQIEGPFIDASGRLPILLQPGDSVEIEISYRPTGYPSRDTAILRLVTSPCPVAESVILYGHADVDRIPTIVVDTLRSYCDGEFEEHLVTFLNGTAFEVSLDSLHLDDGLRVLADPSPVILQSGEQLLLRVMWDRASRGVNRQTIDLYVNGRAEPRRTELVHILGSPSLEVTPATIDLGTLLVCENGAATTFTFSVANSGDVLIDSVRVISATDQVSITTPILEKLEVGESVDVTVRVTGSPGHFTDSIFVFSPYCEEVDTVIVRGEIVSPDITVTPASMLLQGSYLCDFPQSFEVTIFNGSDLPDSVIALSSAFGNLYAVLSTLPQIIPPGGSLSISIAAIPAAPTVVIDSLVVWTSICGGRISVPVEIQARATDWSVYPDSVKMTELLPGEVQGREVLVWNNGQLPAKIENLNFTTPVDGLQISGFPIDSTIDPGSFASIELSYLSDAPTTFQTGLTITGTGCVDTIVAGITGSPGAIPILVSIQGSDLNVDDLYSLPLVLESEGPEAGMTTFRVRLSWEKRGLNFEGLRPSEAADIRILLLETRGLDQVLEIEYFGRPARSDTIGWLDMRILLSDSETWEIDVEGDSIAGEKNEVRYLIDYLDDRVNLANICRIDGTRLIRLRQRLYAHTIVPHPVENGATLQVYSPFAGDLNALITIVDILGESLREFNVILTPGENSIDLDLSAYPRGTYQVVIESGLERVSKEVVRN